MIKSTNYSHFARLRGETPTNLLQSFFLLGVLPVMGAGVVIHACDVMGYLVIPFVVVYSLTALLVWLFPS